MTTPIINFMPSTIWLYQENFSQRWLPHDFVRNTIHNFDFPKQYEETLLLYIGLMTAKKFTFIFIYLPFWKPIGNRAVNIWNLFNHSPGAIVSSKIYEKQRKQKKWTLFSTIKRERTIHRMSFTTERAAAKLIMWVKLLVIYKTASVNTESPTTETLQTCLKSPLKPQSFVHLESHSSHLFLEFTSHPRNFINCKPLLRFKQTSINLSYLFAPLPLATYALKLTSIKLYATFSHLSYTCRWFFNFYKSNHYYISIEDKLHWTHLLHSWCL